MSLVKLSVLSAVALLAGGISFASAQSNPAPTGSTGMSQPQGQCWDAVSNSVKDKTGSASGASTPGGVTTGSSPSGQNNNAKDTGDTKTIPGNAANLPKC